MSKTIQAARRRSKSQKPQKRIGGAIYADEEGNRLFVPTEEMHLFREACQPADVLRRAKLEPRTWERWVTRFGRDHWLFDWLYWLGDPPAGVRLYRPSQWQRVKRGAREGEFFAEPEMIRFRQQLTYRATAKFVGIAPSTVDNWLVKHGATEGFRRWLVYRCDAPGPVDRAYRVAGPADVKHCRKAWDYTGLTRELGMCLGTTYHAWIDDAFPREELHAWLAWLYGGPTPAGWYIVPESVKRLHDRLSPWAIGRAAGLDSATINYALGEPVRRQALRDVTDANRDRRGDAVPPQSSAAWDSLYSDEALGSLDRLPRHARERMRATMLRFASKAKWQCACADAKVSNVNLSTIRRRVRKDFGEEVEDRLNRYIDSWDDLHRRYGVIANGLFVPSPAMLQFRKAATTRSISGRIPALGKRFPAGCLRQWFLDWTLPKEQKGTLALIGTGEAVRGNGESSRGAPAERNVEIPSRQPVLETERVKLFGPGEAPEVNGMALPLLTAAEYAIVQTLIEARSSGERITKDVLAHRTEQTGARVTFDKLRKKNPAWAEVLLPSGAEQLGYRIR